jgi:hypothetical protein
VSELLLEVEKFFATLSATSPARVLLVLVMPGMVLLSATAGNFVPTRNSNILLRL